MLPLPPFDDIIPTDKGEVGVITGVGPSTLNQLDDCGVTVRVAPEDDDGVIMLMVLTVLQKTVEDVLQVPACIGHKRQIWTEAPQLVNSPT